MMKFRNIIEGTAAFLMTSVMASSVVCFADTIPIENATKANDYYVATSTMLPEGCKIEDAAYVGFKFTGYVPGTVINGGIIFNTEKGGWNQKKWGSDEKATGNDDVDFSFAVADYPDEGAEVEIIRPVDHDFDNPGGWSEVAIQHYYALDNKPIKITDVYFLDSNKQRLNAKTVTTDAPVTEAAPAATTTVTTKAATAKAATTTTKPSTNPSTGDSGVGMAVAAAMAAAGVAITFRRKKSE